MKKQNRPTGAERLFSRMSEAELSEEIVPADGEDAAAPQKEDDDSLGYDDEEYMR